ncbi:DUF4747 family protein [Ciceribacter sp. L1K23]|uniref:DUF4747 family protein n=1 Tax=Ciceribacter sp. L1K23 TaxID=2820276 RepID=UPI001B839BEE|nr:DUF4747 family protein [Ciceribacter sp. L1K23]MBR0555470.1 DUF4747 family protein [Ciceribacter sp. L1K23]
MARDSKLEVAAVNIRIPDTHLRDYDSLLDKLASLRRGVKVYGESYVAINFYNSTTKEGIFSKYTEIDIDGEWFDLESFDAAVPEKIEDISIPESLRPNLSQFYFVLDPDLHVVVFSTYAESRGLSTRSVEKYFKEALSWPEIMGVHGRVEADIIKDYGAVEEILALEDLKELHVVIRTPNADDVDKNLAEIIERRLREQQADEYEETLKAKGGHSLKPNERTEKLAKIAAENGQVRARSVVNGVTVDHNTAESPLKEVTTYKDDQAELAVFRGLAENIFAKIREVRAQFNE